MRLDTSQQMRTDMRFRMAPRMIQSMEILQLPLMALQERIDQELIENPVLIDQRGEPEPAKVDSSEERTAGAGARGKLRTGNDRLHRRRLVRFL